MSRVSALIVLLIYVLYLFREVRRSSHMHDTVSEHSDPFDLEQAQSPEERPGLYRFPSITQQASSSPTLPPRTIRFAVEPSLNQSSGSIYRTMGPGATADDDIPSLGNEEQSDRGRKGRDPGIYTHRSNSSRPLFSTRGHSRSLSLGSSRGYRSRDSSMSRLSGERLGGISTLQILRDNRVSIENIRRGQPNDDGSAAGRMASIAMLILSSLLMSVCAEFLVSTVDHVAHNTMSEALIGLVVLPLVGNIAEYITVVSVAMRDKLDLAIAVAVGSSIQITLCVAPLTVVGGWLLNRDLALTFNSFEILTLLGTVLMVNLLVLSEGAEELKTSGLKGALMCACYVVFG